MTLDQNMLDYISLFQSFLLSYSKMLTNVTKKVIALYYTYQFFTNCFARECRFTAIIQMYVDK